MGDPIFESTFGTGRFKSNADDIKQERIDELCKWLLEAQERIASAEALLRSFAYPSGKRAPYDEARFHFERYGERGERAR